MRRKLLAATVTVAIVVAAGVAVAQRHHAATHKGRGATVPDSRLLVAFPPDLVEHTLANMRDHLHALQEITEALARGLRRQGLPRTGSA